MSISIFKKKAPWVMQLLMNDFPFGLEDAAAAVGNLGHESEGLQAINEKNPTVAGSRGGFGWAQWTGPRRRAFEEYCQRNGLNPSSDTAQYKFLFVELTTTEKRAVAMTVAADTLPEKVKAFELGFERAGVKHYDSRLKWAERALEAYAEASAAEKLPPWAEEKPIAAPRGPEQTEVPPMPPIASTIPPAKPDDVGGPVEKAIGAGKGSATGSMVAGGVPAAVIFILQGYDLIPPAMDNAAFGVAIGTILTGFGSYVMAVAGAYNAKKNSV